jgi:hypothetical protein
MLGRESFCKRRHSPIGTRTAASTPRRVTTCGPFVSAASRNSLNLAFASCNCHELIACTFPAKNLEDREPVCFASFALFPLRSWRLKAFLPIHHMTSQLTSQLTWLGWKSIAFCHSEPALFAGEESSVGWTKADSSRYKTALGMTNFSN